MNANINPVEVTSKARQRVARGAAEYAYGPGYRWTYADIYDAYQKPSYAKVRAWWYCRDLCARLNGYDLRVSSRNTFRFSAVFKYCDPETGVLCYAYITPDYDSFCEA